VIRCTIYLAANLAHLDTVHNPLTENEHVKSPPYALRTAIESEGEVCVMVVVRVELSPDVNELASVVFGRV